MSRIIHDPRPQSLVLHYRAQIAALKRAAHPNEQRIAEAYAGLAEARIAAYIESTIAEISPLPPAAASRLAVLLLAPDDVAALRAILQQIAEEADRLEAAAKRLTEAGAS